MRNNSTIMAPVTAKLVAVGDANVEVVASDLQSVPRFGREVVIPAMPLRAAGSAANFALCAASLGSQVGFVGRLGIDRFGEVVVQVFREAGVSMQWTRLVETESTGITLALIREDGERAFITFQGTNAGLKLEDVLPCFEAQPPPRWLHLAGYHLLSQLRGKPTMTLLETAKELGMTTSLDPGWDPADWTSETITTLLEALQFVDIFLPNAVELKALTSERSPRKGAQRLLKLGVSAILVKLGEKGCLLVTQQDHRRIPAFDVDVVDTTAAGDAFDAGFAVSMLSGASLVRAAIFANAVGALKVSRQRDQSLFPSLQEAQAFLMRWRPLEA